MADSVKASTIKIFTWNVDPEVEIIIVHDVVTDEIYSIKWRRTNNG